MAITLYFDQDDTDPPGTSAINSLPPQTGSSKSPEGIEVIDDVPDASVDVCFVHGLAGDRTSAWTVRENPGFWPKTLLALKLEKARILSFGYNTYGYPNLTASPDNFVDHALRLLAELTNDRLASGAPSHPLIFVTRGLGDLICKYAMILSHTSHSDLSRGVYQRLERVIHLGAPNEKDEEIGAEKAFTRSPQRQSATGIDMVQPLFNSLFSTQDGKDNGTYIPLHFEMQSNRLSSVAKLTDSAGLHICDKSQNNGNRIDATTLSESGASAVSTFINDLKASIAVISSRRNETSRHSISETENLASSGIRVVRFPNNGGAPRFRRPAHTVTRLHARSRSPRPITSIQSTSAASSPSPLPATNYRPTSVYKVRPCYIICFLMFLVIAGSATLGIYYTVRFDKMGDGFTAAGWIVAIGTLALAGPLARHYPYCSCWGPRTSYSYELQRINTFSNM